MTEGAADEGAADEGAADEGAADEGAASDISTEPGGPLGSPLGGSRGKTCSTRLRAGLYFADLRIYNVALQVPSGEQCVCGIIGLLIKRADWRSQLGQLVTPMIDCMETRGPDSAGLAVFRENEGGQQRRFALFQKGDPADWSAVEAGLRDLEESAMLRVNDNHAVASADVTAVDFKAWLVANHPQVHLLSVGRAIEMYKDEGLPTEIARRLGFQHLAGTHAVGHTRMATESAVSPAHAHPYTAGEDFCLVHNGSLSNPHTVRRRLQRKGIVFETDNDTEAGCRYFEWRMRQGTPLEDAIADSFQELDGFFTFLMATADKLVLVRDAFACKPAVAAETDDYVAVSSEFRSLAHLPDIASAHVFEPAPERIYSWAV